MKGNAGYQGNTCKIASKTLQTLLSTILKLVVQSLCQKNCVKNNVYWHYRTLSTKIMEKFQNKHDVTMMWLFQGILYRTRRAKIKTDIIIEDNRFICSYMCGLVQILCVLEGKIRLVWWQLLYDLHATGILWFNL